MHDGIQLIKGVGMDFNVVELVNTSDRILALLTESLHFIHNCLDQWAYSTGLHDSKEKVLHPKNREAVAASCCIILSVKYLFHIFSTEKVLLTKNLEAQIAQSNTPIK